MAIKDIFKISRKTFFDPGAWLGVNQLNLYGRIIGNSLKTVMTPDKPRRTETFEEALKRLNVTEAELQNTAKQYQLYSFLFVLLSIGAIVVSFYYLFHHGTFAGWLLGLSMALLFGGQAFRFDFWYYQINQRRLGCTAQEWWQERFSKKGSNV